MIHSGALLARWAAVTIVFVAVSCRQQESRTVLARVGDAELTLEEAKSHVDTTQPSFEVRLRRYVARWVDTELLHQEALRQGIETAKEFQDQLDEARRQMANNYLLERTVYTDSGGSVDEASLRGYFDSHAAEFVIQEQTIKVNLAAFTTREQASAFAAQVSRGTPWSGAVEGALRDTSLTGGLAAVITGHYYTQRTLFPPELWKVALALSPSDVSFPVKAGSGYWVLQPLAILTPGRPANYEQAREEVHQRFLLEQRRQKYEKLLGNLRQRIPVEIFMGPGAPPDTLVPSYD